MKLRKIIATIAAAVVTATSIPTFASIMQVKASAASSSYQTGTYYVDAANGVNVRYGPSSSYGRVGAAPNGTQFVVTDVSGSFGYTDSIYTCGYGYQSGWVHLGYAKLISSNNYTPDNTQTSQTSDNGDYSNYSWIGYLDLNKAKEYADAYAYSYNHDYGVYGVNGSHTYYPSSADLGSRGNDCVHYVVQIMRYAGISNFKMVLNTSTIKSYVTNDLGIEYISYPSISQIEAGDILYTSSGHVTFVQEVDTNNNKVYVTAHTNARNHYNMTSYYRYGVLKTSVLTKTNGSNYTDSKTETTTSETKKASIYTNLYDGTNHYYFDVYGGYTNDETLVTAYPYHGGTNQVFELVPYDETYYYIKCSYADKYWNINRGNGDKYGKLQIYSFYEGASNMLFKFEKASNGQWYIIDKEGFYLYVDGYCNVYADYYRSDMDCCYLTFDLNYLN